MHVCLSFRSFHWNTLKHLQLSQITLQESNVSSVPFGLACTWSQRLVRAGIKVLCPPTSVHKNQQCYCHAALPVVAGSFPTWFLDYINCKCRMMQNECPCFAGRLWHWQCQHSYTQKGWSHDAGTRCCREMMALDHSPFSKRDPKIHFELDVWLAGGREHLGSFRISIASARWC